MNRWSGLVLIAGLAGLGGCTSVPGRESGMGEALITNITADGLRQFTYEYSAGRRPGDGMSGGGGMAGGGTVKGPAGRPPPEGRPVQSAAPHDSKQQVLAQLERRLQQTGFCPQGWFVIRTDHTAGRSVILGECKSAS